jgi:uncharacterized protein (TIGR00288 family)
MPDTARVAVLIDCDNISPKLAAASLGETTKHGTLTVKRGYGDWSSSRLSGWRAALPTLAIQPVQHFAYVAGKNSSDAALIVDAMDLLYSSSVDVFCVVSGDSDFTPLVRRIRESGRKVFGIGPRTTHVSYVNTFDRFTFTEVLASDTADVASPDGQNPSNSAEDETPQSEEIEPGGDAVDGEPLPLPDLREVVSGAIAASQKDDGWAILATVGWYIVNNIPSFDSRNYGFPKLGGLIRALPYVEVREVPDQNGAMQLHVRLREDGGQQPAQNPRSLLSVDEKGQSCSRR